MAARYLQIPQQGRDRFRAHRSASISVQGQLPLRDLLFCTRRGDQGLGYLPRFAVGYRPARHVPAVHVDDRIQIIELPSGTPQKRDIPTPDLIRPLRAQFRRCMLLWRALTPPFVHLILLVQNAIHLSPVTVV